MEETKQIDTVTDKGGGGTDDIVDDNEVQQTEEVNETAAVDVKTDEVKQPIEKSQVQSVIQAGTGVIVKRPAGARPPQKNQLRQQVQPVTSMKTMQEGADRNVQEGDELPEDQQVASSADAKSSLIQQAVQSVIGKRARVTKLQGLLDQIKRNRVTYDQKRTQSNQAMEAVKKGLENYQKLAERLRGKPAQTSGGGTDENVNGKRVKFS